MLREATVPLKGDLIEPGDALEVMPLWFGRWVAYKLTTGGRYELDQAEVNTLRAIRPSEAYDQPSN